MNQANIRSLKVFLATSLIVSHRTLDNILRDSSQMNFVQELSGEKCAFSRLISPSSLDVMGLLCLSYIIAASYEVSIKIMQSKKNHVRIIIHMEARSYQRGVLASGYDLVQHIPT